MTKGKKNTTIPASIDEFMSNSTAETPALVPQWKKKNQQGSDRQFDATSTRVYAICTLLEQIQKVRYTKSIAGLVLEIERGMVK